MTADETKAAGKGPPTTSSCWDPTGVASSLLPGLHVLGGCLISLTLPVSLLGDTGNSNGLPESF